jgi:hypothetical protein
MITIRPKSRIAQFTLSLAFLACSAQATRDDDPRPQPGNPTGGTSFGTGGSTQSTGGFFTAPTGGISSVTGGTGSGGSKGGATAMGGAPTAKGGTTAMGGATTGGVPGVIVTGGTLGAAGSTGAGGSATVVSCDAPWAVGNDGFVKAKAAGTGCWHGYAFASASPKATSTAMPTTFASCGAGCMLCFSGSVGASVEDVALIGFNLSQAPGSSTTAMAKPTGTGVTVSFTKTGTFPLRVQIQAKNATAATRWCYTIPDTATSPVTIPYAMFNTECWEGGAGAAYANGDIEALMLLIPGNADAATPYEACLTGVTEN